MAYSSENSCKKGCSCDSCKSSHKSIKSEGILKTVKDLAKKAKDTATVEIGKALPDVDSDMSGPFPGIGVVVNPLAAKVARNPTVRKVANLFAGAVSSAAEKAAKVAPSVVGEASDPYYGTAQHLQDLKDTKQEHLRNAEQASKNKNYEGAQRYRQMAREVVQKINNHPLHPKNQQKAESMLKESKFVLGDTVVSKEPIQGMQPGHHYKVVNVTRTPSPIGNFVVHTLMHENGSKIMVNNLHAMPVERVPFADKGHVDLAKRYPQNEELKTVDDVTKTLPRGVEKKGPGEAYGDVEKCAPAPKDKEKTVVAGKTGEEYSKKPQEEVKQMKEDKYARLAEAAFGPLNRSNPFRSASLNEEANKVPHPHIKQLMNKVGKHFEDIGLPGGKTKYTGKDSDGKHTFEHELPEDDLGDVSTHHYRVELGDKPRAIHTGEWVEDAEGTNRRENNNPKHNIHLNKDNDKSKVSKAAQQGAMEEEVEYLDEVSYEKAKKTLVDLNKMGHDRQDPATTRFVRHDLKAPPGAYLDTSGERNVARSFDNIARHIERKHGRAAAAAAAHAAIGGPFKSSDSYGSAWVSDKFKALAAEHKPEKMDENILEASQRNLQLRALQAMRAKKDKEAALAKKEAENKDKDEMSKEKLIALHDRGYKPREESINQKFPDVEHIDEGEVIKFPTKPKPTSTKPSQVLTTATRRPPGPRPVKENLNQRFPDVERDIAAIMKESYKKTKLKEDATNIYIATPEQREDWLNVGRGAMDVLDYINKYKV